ncbi:Pleckstrin y domain-containing A member 4 [Podila epicladia]|nr:Pleckstrin y domain-containing A member 4 [Podila epicladia]
MTMNKSKKRVPFLDKPTHLPIHIVSSSSSSSSSSVPSNSNTFAGSDLATKHLYMASPSPHAHQGFNPFDSYSQKYLQNHPFPSNHQHLTPKPEERSNFSKKKSRSKSESHGDAKDDRDKKDKDKKDKTPYHHRRSSINQTPSTIESLFQQERQLREIVDDRMVLEEWLFKRSSSLQLVWKKRWCVLRNDCLYYYSSNTDTKPLGVLHLADFSILTTGADLSRKSKHAFRLSAAESIPHESRHHLFHTETASSLDAWVEAIQTHIDHAQSTLTLPTLGPLDIGLGGPQYSQSSGVNGYHPYAQHPTGDKSIIDKVLDRLQLLADEHEIDPTLSDMNDPSTLIMPAQEHPSHTLYPFTKSHQGICVDDSLDGWPVSPSHLSKTSQGIKSSLDSVREYVATTTVRMPTGIRTPPPASTLSIPSRPKIKHAETNSNSSSYTDVSHSNYSSYSDASYGRLKQRMAMQAFEAKSGFGSSSPLIQAFGIPSTSSSMNSYLPLSPDIHPQRHFHSSHQHDYHHSQGLSIPASVNLTEGIVQGSSGSTLRLDNRKDRHQKSDPIPGANGLRTSESSHRALKKKQSMPAIASTPGSSSGAVSLPSKDDKDTKKSRKLWSGFGGSSSSSSPPSQMLISESLATGHPSSTSPPIVPRITSGLSRSIDINSPWFKDLILISSPPKPSSIHTAASAPTSTSSTKKNSSRGFTSKSMVSLSKSSAPLDHAMPPPPPHSHFDKYRDSVNLNRARSPSISVLESCPHHSYQPLIPSNSNANMSQSPKLLSFNRHHHHQGLEQFTSDPIPSVGHLLTGFSNDEDLLSTQRTAATSSAGSRHCKSGPIPTSTTAPLSPRLPAWTRFGDKSQAAHKNPKWYVEPEVQMPLSEEQKTGPPYHAHDLGYQDNQSMEYIAGVSRHILAPIELAQAMEQEEEEARRSKQSREKQGTDGLVRESDAPPPVPLRRDLTMRQPPALETSSLDTTFKKQEAAGESQSPEAIIETSPANAILLSVIAATAAPVGPQPLQDKVSVVSKAGLMPQESRRFSVSITAVSAMAHAQVLETRSQASPPPVIPRRSPHRGPLSPILKDV